MFSPAMLPEHQADGDTVRETQRMEHLQSGEGENFSPGYV